jgi:mannose-1-phosphate guanylyltransferase / mannose-6-phosphate isomerase
LRCRWRWHTNPTTENTDRIDRELIEVQTGSYLGEDDIERIEDDYHRS